MSGKKPFAKFILFLAAFLLGIVLLCLAGYRYLCGLTPVYGETFYAGLKTKYDRMVSIEEPKIIVIGGSSVAFGIDSKLVERETGMPCVNFGLYAAIGLRPMMDLAKDHVRRGDIVILAPELSAQMYSGYIGYDYLVDSIEGRPDMAFALGRDYAQGFLTAVPRYLSRRSEILKSGLFVEGVYAFSSFDAYGDLIYPRTANVMSGGFQKTGLPDFSTEILTEEFFQLVNSFAEECRFEGASVFFGFPPINALSVNCGSGERDAFVRRLEEGLNFRILSSLEDHILDAGYFYDSNFHANDPGTVYNTILLINDLKRVTGNMSPVSVPVPEPFAKSGGGLNGELLSDGVFLYMLSEKGILIKGLTEEGRALAVLTVPSELSGYRVYGIDSFAFENSKAFSVILPESVSSMGEGIFKNASSLKTVSLHCRSLPEVSADLLYGAPDGLVLYVNKEVYGRFVTDYFWGAFSDVLRPAE